MNAKIIKGVGRLLLFLSVCITVSACGLKGDLYLPDSQAFISDQGEQVAKRYYG